MRRSKDKMTKIREHAHKKIRSFIENYRHVFEVVLDVLHFYILPPLLIYAFYYTYWLWNASFVDHASYVDIQFSLRGNSPCASGRRAHTRYYCNDVEISFSQFLYLSVDKKKDFSNHNFVRIIRK